MQLSTNLLTCSGPVTSNGRNNYNLWLLVVVTPEHHILKNNDNNKKSKEQREQK